MTSEIPLDLEKFDSKKIVNATTDFISMCFANDLDIWSDKEEAPGRGMFNDFAILYRYPITHGKEESNVIVYNIRNEKASEIYSKILKINVPKNNAISKIPAIGDVKNGMRVFLSKSRMIYAVLVFDSKGGMTGAQLPELSREDMVLEMQRVIKRHHPSLN